MAAEDSGSGFSSNEPRPGARGQGFYTLHLKLLGQPVLLEAGNPSHREVTARCVALCPPRRDHARVWPVRARSLGGQAQAQALLTPLSLLGTSLQHPSCWEHCRPQITRAVTLLAITLQALTAQQALGH